MPNEKGENNNSENKFPNKGNFSASQNNIGNRLNQIRENGNNTPKQLNNNQRRLTDNPQGLRDNLNKQVTKKGLEMAANAALPGSGELAKEAMNTELGNKVVNAATELSKAKPFNFEKKVSKFFSDKVSQSETTDEEESEEDGEVLISNKAKKIIIPTVSIGSLGCTIMIILIVILIFLMISPILFVQDLAKNAKEAATGFWDGIVSFFKGCSNEEECALKEQKTFYDTIIDVKNEYQQKYNITLDTDLITATLTYYDPVDTGDALEESDEKLLTSNGANFKKSKSKINVLAYNQLGQGKKCVTESGKVLAEYKEENKNTPCPSSDTEEIVNEEIWYYLDLDKYDKYLEEVFIRQYYFDNVVSDQVDKSIPVVIREIHDRVELVKYLNSSQNSSSNFIANNTQVIVMNCSGTIELETISLYEYLQGVLYVEGYATGRPEEFLKVMAVAAKGYLYAVNHATVDSMPTTLKIRSCQMNQEYCNVEKGCHNMQDGTSDEHDSHDTIATGPDANGNYFRAPLTSDVETLEKIKRAIDSTLSEFIVKDNKILMTQYRASCSGTCDSTTNILDQAVAYQMVKDGSSYKDVLAYFYDGELTEIKLGAGLVGYPLDIVYNNVTSAFGWRFHPVYHVCKHHNGTDIAAPADANIYAIADGVVTENRYNGGYGNVVVIGHGQQNSSGYYEYYSLYAHQIRLSNKVSVGESVKAGQLIGNVGTTGTSTGNHLHIEIYTMPNGVKVRQDAVESFSGVELKGMVGGARYNSEAACKAAN